MRMRVGAMTFAAAAAVAVLFAVAAPAHASHRGIKCQLSLTGSFSPLLGPGANSGTYRAQTAELGNRSHCTFQNFIAAYQAPVTTSGTFAATSCGNALLTSDPADFGTHVDFDSTIVFGDLEGPIVWQMSYTIELRNWQGLVRVSHVNGRVEEGGDDIDGVLAIPPPHACLTRGVETFMAHGAVALVW
jgi:hypothetical protein